MDTEDDETGHWLDYQESISRGLVACQPEKILPHTQVQLASVHLDKANTNNQIACSSKWMRLDENWCDYTIILFSSHFSDLH